MKIVVFSQKSFFDKKLQKQTIYEWDKGFLQYKTTDPEKPYKVINMQIK